MRSWLVLLGGMLVWTVHFFGVYAIAEIAPIRWLVIALTLLCLAAFAWLLRRARALPASDGFAAWRRSVALGGIGLGFVGVVWQALPALAG